MAQAPQFVTRDRELERGHEQATEKLAEHRWHWTLDESNADRVSIREYARQVGRGETSVRNMVNGYAAWKGAHGSARTGGPTTLMDYIEHAKLATDKAEATEAVAAATGKSFATASRTDRVEVREVLATAQDRAERKGTTVSEELPAVAEWREKARKARRTEKQERQRTKAFFLIEVESHIGAAIRQLREALALVRDVDFDEEQVEMLEGSIETLRTLVGLIDVRVSGRSGTDWDAAFAEIMEEA